MYAPEPYLFPVIPTILVLEYSVHNITLLDKCTNFVCIFVHLYHFLPFFFLSKSVFKEFLRVKKDRYCRMIVRTFVFSFFLPFLLFEFAFQLSFFLLSCDRDKIVFTNIELCKIWINRNPDFRHCNKNYCFRYLRPLYTGCFIIL